MNKIGTASGHSVTTYIEDSLVSAAGNVELSAASTANMRALAIGGALSTARGSMGLGNELAGAAAGAYASNEASRTVAAYITGSTVTTTGGGDVSLSASDSTQSIRSDAFGVAAAYASATDGTDTSGALSIGVAIASNTVSSTVKAYVDRSSVIASTGCRRRSTWTRWSALPPGSRATGTSHASRWRGCGREASSPFPARFPRTRGHDGH